MSKHLDKALEYVRANKTWSDEEEKEALAHIDLYRCPINRASAEIADEITDLLNEYGDENGLPTDWWTNETDVDDVFFKL